MFVFMKSQQSCGEKDPQSAVGEFNQCLLKCSKEFFQMQAFGQSYSVLIGIGLNDNHLHTGCPDFFQLGGIACGICNKY